MQDVVVGYIHGDNVTQEFHHSLFHAAYHDLFGAHRILDYAYDFSTSNLSRARNGIVTKFLAHEQAEWFWIVDSDAVFPANMLHSLLADADPVARPIVGALAHLVRGKLDDEGNPVRDRHGAQVRTVIPTLYKMIRNDEGTIVSYMESTDYGQGLLEVDATGCHCLLVHRSVFEAIKSEHSYRWFREDEISPGLVVGEDIWFCLQARELGFPIYVDTRLESGHVKRFVMTSDMAGEGGPRWSVARSTSP